MAMWESPVRPWSAALPIRMCTLAAVLGCAVSAQAAAFRAAAVKIDITPAAPQRLLGYGERVSSGVHDRLYHRILALDDGAATWVLVSTEVCLVSPGFYDEVAAAVQRETGIPRSHFWWTATHTHAAPELGPPGLTKIMMPQRFTKDYDHEYAEQVKQSLIDGVRQARAKLEPAVLGVTTGMSSANINRRARGPKGGISLGLNPDGPVDRQIGLLRLARPDGSLIALIANYSMHGTVLGQENTLISGDAPGIVADYVEGKLATTMLFINGAAGDQAPIYSVTPDFKKSHITEFSVLLGDKILAAYHAMGAGSSTATIRAEEKIVESPLRKEVAWDASLPSYLRVTAAGESLVRLPVRFLHLGKDIVLWGAPVELFSGISMQVRQRSPFPYTFFFGYTNGWMGYLPTKQAFAEGGYETGANTSPFTDRVEEDLIQGVTGYLQGQPR